MTAPRGDLGAQHNTCEACGDPIPSHGGVALVCGPGGGELRLPPPRVCNTRECREARDQAAIQRAIAAGVINP